MEPSLNPLLYKAHPLLFRAVDLLLHPGAYSGVEIVGLAAIFLGINQLWAVAMWQASQSLTEVRLSLRASYGLALPACVLYAPLLMTVLGDVLDHNFRLEDRVILVFAILVGSQMLGVLYGLTLRNPHGGPIGIRTGLAISLLLLLTSLPFGLVLIWLNSMFRLV